MNIYKRHQFKCPFCQEWYDPKKNLLPFEMLCGHSICSRCISSYENKSKTSVVCPNHGSSQFLSKVKLNTHLLEARQRLAKHLTESYCNNNEISQHSDLDVTLRSQQDEIKSFQQLMEQIYNNEINRIICLKNRIKQEINQPLLALMRWKNIKKTLNNKNQILLQKRMVEEKIKQFNLLNIQEMANKVIEDSSQCFKRHFSIYHLKQARKEQRKTLKSSVKHHNERIYNKSIISNQTNEQKQNILINFVNSVESPLLESRSSQLCKQLTSFKLQDSLSPQYQSKVVLPKQQKTNSQYMKLPKQYSSTEYLKECSNGQTTLREFQQSKCSLAIKLPQEKRQKRQSSQNFQDLIFSLKSCESDQLQYSPENDAPEDQLLLSEQKHDINFLRQYGIQNKKIKKQQMQVRQRQLVNSQKQKTKYIKKMEITRTQQAYYNTNIYHNTLQLINIDLKEVDLKKYLDKFNWKQIQVIKMVGTGLENPQLNQILNYMVNTNVHSLILPNNQLQQLSLDALIRFTEVSSLLKIVSLQKNNIQMLHGNAKAKLALLRKKGVTVYI